MFPIMAGNSAPTGYNLTRSLRWRSSASANLTRTPSASGSLTTWTWSNWIKFGNLATANKFIFCASSNPIFYTGFQYSQNKLTFYEMFNGTEIANVVTSAVLRDPSAWYHVMCVYDSTQATGSNRVKIYINGVQAAVTFTTTPALNQTSQMNASGQTIYIGSAMNSTQYFDGYMAEVNFVNAQALTPSSFGSTNTLTGVWQLAPYTGTYGTNGFELQFTDNSALTTSSNVGLGKDFSGNGNYFATNNISITAGVTYDSMTDVPTLTSATAANFPVFNPLTYVSPQPSTTYSNGNLQVTGNNGASHSIMPSTIAMPSGKWYAEFTLGAVGGAYPLVGLIATTTSAANTNYLGGVASTYGYGSDGQKYNSTPSAYGSSFTAGDIIAIAFDATAGSLTFYKNNVSQGVAFSGLTGSYFMAVDAYNAGYWNANFGQRSFTYTPPAGFVALNTYNLPTGAILKGNTVMDSTLYTGNGSTQTITNAAGFKPDLVWVKSRASYYSHIWYDSVRGTGTTKMLSSNLTDAEGSLSANANLTSFNSNGFSVGTTGSTNVLNTNADSLVAWQWQAGQGSTSSNTNGSITSTVSVNAGAGFSVVTYTGTGANATVGHGLGVAPQLVIVKQRGGATNWTVWHSGLTSAAYYLSLNTLEAQANNTGVWNNTAPTSSVFSVGSYAVNNGSAATYVAYCWTPIAGYSAFGSYPGNGSDDGPFVYLGFRPKWVLIKSTGSDNWILHDTGRNTYNTMTSDLYPNLANIEDQSWYVDSLSNGFKIRSGGSTAMNSSGSTYIYIAFAENPFKNALAR